MGKTLEQRIAAKEAELARLKERQRRERNKRLILIGIAAEKAAQADPKFYQLLSEAAQAHLKPEDQAKTGLTDRYGNPLPLSI